MHLSIKCVWKTYFKLDYQINISMRVSIFIFAFTDTLPARLLQLSKEKFWVTVLSSVCAET